MDGGLRHAGGAGGEAEQAGVIDPGRDRQEIIGGTREQGAELAAGGAGPGDDPFQAIGEGACLIEILDQGGVA